MTLQHVRITLLAPRPAGPSFDLEPFIAIFHRWIREDVVADLVPIDVADYRHLRDHPRVLLVAHHGHLGVNRRPDGAIGLFYEQKRDALGPAADKLSAGLAQVRLLAKQVESEPSLEGRLTFDPGSLEVSVHSRLVAETSGELVEPVRAFAESLADEAVVYAVPSSIPTVQVSLRGGAGV